MAIAHTQTEQTSSPIITVLTIQCACQNRCKSDRSEEVNGKADDATSAGFIGASFRRSDRADDWAMTGAARWCRTTKGISGRRIGAPTRPEFHEDPEPDPPPARPEIIAKLVQTRALHRSFAGTEAHLPLMRR